MGDNAQSVWRRVAKSEIVLFVGNMSNSSGLNLVGFGSISPLGPTPLRF